MAGDVIVTPDCPMEAIPQASKTGAEPRDAGAMGYENLPVTRDGDVESDFTQQAKLTPSYHRWALDPIGADGGTLLYAQPAVDRSFIRYWERAWRGLAGIVSDYGAASPFLPC
jgi:hypothetical protein